MINTLIFDFGNVFIDLDLENGLKTATAFEKELKKGNTKLHYNFLEVLDKIHVYLY